MNIEICKKCKHFAIAANWPKTMYPEIIRSFREIYCLISDTIDGADNAKGRFLGIVKNGKPEYFEWFKMPEQCPYRLEHVMSESNDEP